MNDDHHRPFHDWRRAIPVAASAPPAHGDTELVVGSDIVDDPVLPRYGAGALSDVVPSLLAGLGVPGMTNLLGLPPARRVCLLLLDGLGWHQLSDHADQAPFLAALAGGRKPITAGFPTTTATSIASLGTGLPPGEHGIVGYSFALGDGALINALSWGEYETDPPVDWRRRFVPEQVQPRRTAFEQADAADVAVHLAVPPAHRGTGLTRAVLRGAEIHPVHALGDLVGTSLRCLADHDRVLCYSYHGDLDLLGHLYGPGSLPWRAQLRFLNHLVAAIASGLPGDALLVVTADHGMVGVGERDRVDFDTTMALQDGVQMLGGEARARYLYTEPGAAADVVQAWRDVLGERAWIATREEVIDSGWLGPRVADQIRGRIGDVVAAAVGALAVVRSVVEPRSSAMLGHHGSVTADELLVPLLVCGAATGHAVE